MLTVVHDAQSANESDGARGRSLLDEIVRDGARQSGNGFFSAILPAWARKSPQMTEVLPLPYLHGLSTSDFGPALEQFLGSGAGLSTTTITRLTAQWQDEAKTLK